MWPNILDSEPAPVGRLAHTRQPSLGLRFIAANEFIIHISVQPSKVTGPRLSRGQSPIHHPSVCRDGSALWDTIWHLPGPDKTYSIYRRMKLTTGEIKNGSFLSVPLGNTGPEA